MLPKAQLSSTLKGSEASFFFSSSEDVFGPARLTDLFPAIPVAHRVCGNMYTPCLPCMIITYFFFLNWNTLRLSQKPECKL